MSRTCHDCTHCKSWYISPTREEPGDEGWECTYPWPEGWEPDDKEYDELEAEICIHFERKPEYQETYNLIMAEEF